MRLPSVFRSAAFRLASLYALIFAVSVSIFAALAYFSISAALEAKIQARVEIESANLAQEYRNGGLDHLVSLVKARERGLNGGFDYSILDEKGQPIYGSIPRQPKGAGWAEFRRAPDGDEAPGDLERFIVLTTPLSGGWSLLVGDDLNPVDDLERAVRSGLALAVAAIFLLSVAGGAILSRGFLRRVEGIARTAEAIMAGHVRVRVPRTGTGDDLDRLSETLNRMLDRNASLIESLRQVTNDIAHDLRTPLGRLRQGLDEARRETLSPARAAVAIEQAIGETDSILATFAALLRIAEIEAGTRRQAFETIDLSDLVRTVCQAFAPAIEDEGRSLAYRAEPACRIFGDANLLSQMAANLVENAAHHTPPGTRILVAVRAERDLVVLEVADDGPGVPEAERGRIFDRFYRLERSRGTAGNGLGLSIVAAIADLHRAAIATSDNGPGFRVEVSFPAAAPPAETGAGTGADQARSAAPAAAGG